MVRYIRHIAYSGFETFEKIWKDEDGCATEFGVLSSAAPLETARLPEFFSGAKFHDLHLAPGEYFPRMARPFGAKHLAELTPSPMPDLSVSPGGNPDKSPKALEERVTSTGQLHALIVQLEQVCRVIHPKIDNFSTYGHELRSILLVACTEVEAQCKSILRANGKKEDEARNMSDYFVLNEAMKLDQYVVSLSYYPWLAPLKPFDGWLYDKSSKSLSWYNAYNQVKHDREACFSQATLGNALSAVTACFVMLCGQYGKDFALSGEAGERAFFNLIGAPDWPPGEVYIRGDTRPVLYFDNNTV